MLPPVAHVTCEHDFLMHRNEMRVTGENTNVHRAVSDAAATQTE